MFELWRDGQPPWFAEGVKEIFQGQDAFNAAVVAGHNAYAAAHDDLALRYGTLVESHNRVRDLSVELAKQLVEQRQVRAADVEDTLKALQAAGEKVVMLEERIRSVETQWLPDLERQLH